MKTVVLLVGAVAAGLSIAWIDSRPGWDDTSVTAGAVFLVCAALGWMNPKYAWLWALTVGIWIPAAGIVRQGNYGSLLALAFAFAGSFLGAVARKAFTSARPQR